MTGEVKGGRASRSLKARCALIAGTALVLGCSVQGESVETTTVATDPQPDGSASEQGSDVDAASVVMAHLKRTRAGTKHSVDSVPLAFSGFTCMISMAHDHHARERRWLLNAKTNTLLTEATAKGVLERLRFADQASQYSAVDWATVALCASGSGAMLVTQPATDGPTAPRLTVTKSEPELVFWTQHDNHRARPDARKHTAAVGWAGRVSVTVSEPISIGR